MGIKSKGNPDEEAFNYVLDMVEISVQDVGFGSVTVVFQDGRAIQMEKNEKIRLDQVCMLEGSSTGKQTQTEKKFSAKSDLRTRFSQICKGLKYGQVVLQIKSGKVTQIDRTDKLRFPEVEGKFGDGI